MSKKRGFTLVEVLVVLAVTTLAFILIGGFLVYLSESSGMLITESEELITAQSIEDYLRGYINTEFEKISDDAEKDTKKDAVFDSLLASPVGNDHINTSGKIRRDAEGNLRLYSNDVDNTVVFKNTGLTFFTIYNSDGFLKCEMHFESGAEFSFILGVYKKNGG